MWLFDTSLSPSRTKGSPEDTAQNQAYNHFGIPDD
jgi:hypothetical protein